MAHLYPITEPYSSGKLRVGDGHRIHWEVAGVATTMAFLLEPSEEGTRVTMDAHVRGKGLSRLLAPIVTREMRKSTVVALADLRRIFDDES